MILTFLMLLATVINSDSLSSNHSNLETGVFFYSNASANLRDGIRSFSVDTLLVFPKLNYKTEFVEFNAIASLDYTEDFTSAMIKPVKADAFFRWPGSPWIASGVTRGPIDFYVQGLNQPVIEWNSLDLSDSTTVTLQAGGLMGFEGFWHQMGDSLAWYGIKSPWLGFGMVDFDFFENKSTSIQTISGFIALKKIQPWFVFVENDSQWSYFSEIRNWKPFANSFVSVEIVPQFSQVQDTTQVGLTSYIRGQNLAIAGSFSAQMDIEMQSDPSFATTFDLFSEVGISWSLEAYADKLENYHGSISGFYRMQPAGCGGKIDVFEDSTRVSVTAFYSPLATVSTEFTVLSDLSHDSPSPACFVRVFGVTDFLTSNIILHWQENVTSLGIGVSAWLN